MAWTANGVYPVRVLYLHDGAVCDPSAPSVLPAHATPACFSS